MADLVLAEKDPATVIGDALAAYKQATISPQNPNGVTLAPADPRRLHLQALLLLVTQLRGLIDFSGKQSLLRFVSDQFIDELALLWGLLRIEPKPSTCVERFLFATVAARTIQSGVRVTDGINQWFVVTATSATDDHIDATVECVVPGVSTNGIAMDQIDTLVDPDLVPGCTGVTNTTETISGRDIETLEELRGRLRDAPESTSTAGPRSAYKALALAASASVADVAVLGAVDAEEVAAAPPGSGEVVIVAIKGARDENGVLISVVPDPDDGLLDVLRAALTGEEVRPLTDLVTVRAPNWVDFDCHVTYYIARSRSDSAPDIEAAVQAAFDGYLLWQQSAIGRDINPSELIARIMNAGAKRVVVSEPSYTALLRDQSARLVYQSLTDGGVEDD